MNNLQIFNCENKEVRTVMIDGEPWWVLKDVCDVLSIANSRDTLTRLDNDEKNTVGLTDGKGNPNKTVINESGLYNVIFRSDKPEAKAFKRWVTRKVLPRIRKTGTYSFGGMSACDRIKAARIISKTPEHAMPYVLQLLGMRYDETRQTCSAEKSQDELAYFLANFNAGGEPTNDAFKAFKTRYPKSKMCQIAFSREVARRLNTAVVSKRVDGTTRRVFAKRS